MYRSFTTFKSFKRVEGYRWLRSNGKPSFTSYIYEREGDIVYVMTTPVYTVAPTTPVREVARIMTTHDIRSIPIADARKVIKGIVVAMDLVNYLGGGNLYEIVKVKHGDNIYSALDEPVNSLMNDRPIIISISDSIVKALEKMITENVGVLPVVSDDGKVRGIVTERDLVKHFIEPRQWNIIVEDIMSKNVITIRRDATLIDAAEIMVKLKIRRLPVINVKGEVMGMLTAKDYVRFFGTNRVFKKIVRGELKEALRTPVSEVMNDKIITIEPSADIGEAAKKMLDNGTSSLLVTKDNMLVGIITEKDLIYAVALSR